MSKLHITKGSGKMDGMVSINTYATSNPFCQKMAKTNSVCGKCYAQRYEGIRKSLEKPFEANAEVLKSPDYIPEEIYHRIVRLHSFGELHNVTHFRNFVKLAFVNPETTFTLWTKRKNIVQAYIKKGGIIPSNLIMIFSNSSLIKQVTKVPKGFDKVFNVVSKATAQAQNITINCGAKSCLGCMTCYTDNDTEILYESLK